MGAKHPYTRYDPINPINPSPQPAQGVPGDAEEAPLLLAWTSVFRVFGLSKP